MVLEMKRQLTVLTTKAAGGSRGFTPRAEKTKNNRRIQFRFAAEPLKEGGNWSQSVSNKGMRTASLHSFSHDDFENAVYAVKFHEAAIDSNDADESDALCILAGGKPDVVGG
ncbi:hypothetical protein CYMTET_24158 [Cymbomonas tetramitiformis]|uniref:Uncharacterized protein n=1 Tax=Cymbomonas tetramitiformis TaxID=36881 RepID=A0AAE0FWE9_9CHLO|nr:hypothetical protein CYMTET_24158 [Cymbomonas tetramitiformis]